MDRRRRNPEKLKALYVVGAKIRSPPFREIRARVAGNLGLLIVHELFFDGKTRADGPTLSFSPAASAYEKDGSRHKYGPAKIQTAA